MQTIRRTDILTAPLILLFSYAAAAKAADITKFRGQLYLQPIPHALSEILVYTLPGLELAIAGLLIAGRTRKAGLTGSLVLLSAFTIYISLGLLHVWKRVPCSCGGILEKMGWGTHLAFNWAFIIINIAAISFDRRGKPELT